jgi:hypothetical protein
MADSVSRGEDMKAKLAPFAVLLGLLTALFLGMAAQAQATGGKPANCSQDLLVICTVDVDQDGDFDIEVKFPVDRVLTGNELDILETELDLAVKDNDITVPLSVGEITILKDTVVSVLSGFHPVIIISPTVIIILPCGC